MERMSLDSPPCAFARERVYLSFYKPRAFGPFPPPPHCASTTPPGRKSREIKTVFPVGDALMLSPGGKRRSLAFSLHPLCHSALTATSKVTERCRFHLQTSVALPVWVLSLTFSRFVGTCRNRKRACTCSSRQIQS